MHRYDRHWRRPDGPRYVKLWVDATPDNRHEEADIQQMFEGQRTTDPTYSRRAPPTTETPMFGDQCPSPEEPPQAIVPRLSRGGLISLFGGLRPHASGVPTGSPLTD